MEPANNEIDADQVKKNLDELSDLDGEDEEKKEKEEALEIGE